VAARAQQGGRGRRIVQLMSMADDDPEAQSRVAAFESGLRELGWLDGRDLRIDFRWGAGDAERNRCHHTMCRLRRGGLLFREASNHGFWRLLWHRFNRACSCFRRNPIV
jgi:hypothetical protein